MSVKFTTIARVNPRDPDAPKKHYVQIKNTGKVTMHDIAQEIAEMSTVSSVDVAAMIEAFLTIVPKELSRGNIVSLGDFGSFSLRIHSEGSEEPEDVSVHNILKVLTTFRPGKRFREVLGNIDFEKTPE